MTDGRNVGNKKRHTVAQDVVNDIIPVSVQPQFFLASRSGQTQPDITHSGAPPGRLPAVQSTYRLKTDLRKATFPYRRAGVAMVCILSASQELFLFFFEQPKRVHLNHQ